MLAVEMQATCCAICRTENNAVELYPANLGAEAFSPEAFSARRLPDRLHYRIVRCRTCGLVRSDPVADRELLEQLYAKSTFEYGEEVGNLQRTYGRYLARLERYGAVKGSLLEIGCGNGFVLETAQEQGYRTVCGVEPSADAVERASERIRPSIVCDVMRPGTFPAGEFDTICMFQVFDHIAEPCELLDECFRTLRRGGLVLCLNHNVEAASARLMRDRSPIIDVEHTYLYSPTTLRSLFERHGFSILRVGPAFNVYTIHYLARLLPLPTGLKGGMLSFLERTRVGRLRVSAPLGNMYVIARKP